MTQIVEIRNSDDPRDAIHRACHRLAEGDLVAFPTETVYLVVANPLSSRGIEKLVALQPEGRRTLLLKSCFELWDYAPKLPSFADKLSRRGWPGPLTIAMNRSLVEGVFNDFDENVRKALTGSDSTVSFRSPAQPLLLETLKLCPAPLIACAEFSSGEMLPRSAAEVASRFGDQLTMIFDDGPCRYGEPSTVVNVDSDRWQVVEKIMQ